MAPKSAPAAPPAPKGFCVERTIPAGQHPLLAVFPGLDRLPPAAKMEPRPAKRARLFDETGIEVVDQDMWMYVAPWETPPFARRRGWTPVVTPGKDCIVVGQGHLRESAAILLYLDIYHELCHILQRRDGANLWEPGLSYVERKTEIDAYRFVIDDARALGVSDEYLREYLKVEWISPAEHRQLLVAVGVPAAVRSRPAARA